ncbi:MAG TPA: hypothetical protein DCW96_06735 [Stenotrophomonas sp.]|nr:hypothetical protein [Stenotrophomonas sp.]
MLTIKSASQLLLLAAMVSLAGCAATGQVAKPAAWPTVPPLPQPLQNKTDYAGSVRHELYGPASSPSPSETKP